MLCKLAQPRNDLRVAPVHAVELADGQGPAPQCFRNLVDGSQDLQGYLSIFFLSTDDADGHRCFYL